MRMQKRRLDIIATWKSRSIILGLGTIAIIVLLMAIAYPVGSAFPSTTSWYWNFSS
jgi:hypothetical protein